MAANRPTGCDAGNEAAAAPEGNKDPGRRVPTRRLKWELRRGAKVRSETVRDSANSFGMEARDRDVIG